MELFAMVLAGQTMCDCAWPGSTASSGNAKSGDSSGSKGSKGGKDTKDSSTSATKGSAAGTGKSKLAVVPADQKIVSDSYKQGGSSGSVQTAIMNDPPSM